MKKTNSLKKALLLTTFAIPFMTVRATSYVANDWDVYKNRTKEQIQEQYNKAQETNSYVNGKTDTYYKVKPVTAAPYAAGELTADTHNAMSKMVNYYRWLVGVSPLKANSTHRDDLQAGALVRIKLDNFAHFLTDDQKPENMTEELWQLGKNADHNIIAWGYTPTGSITGWLDEGYNLSEKTFDTTGHRQAIIGPNVSKLQFGYVSPTAMGDIVESKNTSDLAYTAFPVPGYMPNNILNDNTSAWNLVLNSNKLTYSDAKDITVRVTNLKDNSTYDCTVANGKLQVNSNELVFVQPSVEAYQYGDNDSYKVEVLGLTEKDAKAKAATTVEYTVNFFDVEADLTDKTAEDKKEEDKKEPEKDVTNTNNNSNTSNETKPAESTANTKNPTNEEENPATSDPIVTSAALFIVSIGGAFVTYKILKKEN